jgi:hypothetical protein
MLVHGREAGTKLNVERSGRVFQTSLRATSCPLTFARSGREAGATFAAHPLRSLTHVRSCCAPTFAI